ncbi:DUF5133 domain-containing protein [Streptomyces sp. FXJ1.172]|uniref:DUF5133 domain-containing protein n=1 Tax=Streptomyces sp. FXJ1.172 TaxID=710705 RepID=UPI00082FC6F4|nr:DUF5133 domain-containing protein [Streptomyces sp. FXJ1.172]WEO93082.1 DUF5133 domain-containing protein [Streptomyces sp. FXJ1.172]
MLMPHPTTLRRLVKEYEALIATKALADDVSVGTRLQDLAYTLCVSTGTQEVSHALRVAQDYLDHTIDSVDGTGAASGTGRAPTIVSPGQVARTPTHTPARSVLPQG